MKLIIGLGNPGKKYQHTRHNAGYMAVSDFAGRHEIELNKKRHKSLVGAFTKDAEKIIVALPLTYMNLSGEAVRGLLGRSAVSHKDIMVVCDDINLDFGALRMRSRGSDGGHNGLKSIVDALGSSDFARLRIGIGRNSPGEDASDYVLSHFGKDQKAQLKRVIEQAVRALDLWVEKGMVNAMNAFNTPKRKSVKKDE